jgi:hypothetical protein
MKSILATLLLFSVNLIFGQNNFPASWQGEWTGKLDIVTAAGKLQELPMELHILPIDSSENFTWTIIYGEDREAGKRSYELVTLDAAKGLYAIDEKNSIQMEAYLLGGKFYQWFEVSGSLITTATWLEGEELIWELVSGSIKPVSTTGGQEVEGEEIPAVKTFPVKVMQVARLKRK